MMWKRKGRNLTQSYDKSLYIHWKIQKLVTTQKRHQKLRLHNECIIHRDIVEYPLLSGENDTRTVFKSNCNIVDQSDQNFLKEYYTFIVCVYPFSEMKQLKVFENKKVHEFIEYSSSNSEQLLLSVCLCLRITDEGSVPEMRIWSILLIKSFVKWCIHLSRSLFLNFNYLVSVTAVGPKIPPRTYVAKFYGRLRLIRSLWWASKFPCFKIHWNCNFVGL